MLLRGRPVCTTGTSVDKMVGIFVTLTQPRTLDRLSSRSHHLLIVHIRAAASAAAAEAMMGECDMVNAPAM